MRDVASADLVVAARAAAQRDHQHAVGAEPERGGERGIRGGCRRPRSTSGPRARQGTAPGSRRTRARARPAARPGARPGSGRGPSPRPARGTGGRRPPGRSRSRSRRRRSRRGVRPPGSRRSAASPPSGAPAPRAVAVSSRPEMRSGSGWSPRRNARGTSQPIARSGVASRAPVLSDASEPIERRPQIRASRSPDRNGRCAVAARKHAWMAPTEAPVMMSKRGGLPSRRGSSSSR